MSIAETLHHPVRRAPLTPPRPNLAPDTMTPLQRLRAIRTNAITSWGAQAYQDDVIAGKFFGRRSYILNSPDAIRHVLVDNYENYFRTPVGLRVLRPMLGDGLLTAFGKSWKHQRRTLAPAFTPRAVATLVPHMLSATDEAIGALMPLCGQPVDLREAMQRMTLEIAGRTMFSLQMGEHGAALRHFVLDYGIRYASARLLDILLPLSIPSPTDISRARFRRRWTSFVGRLIRERRAMVSADGAPRDLFDLMVAARDPETGAAFSDALLGDEVATMILAGHETTATALFWSLYLLALDPATQDDLADSIEGVTIDASTDITRLAMTRAVIDETMRLYPPAFLVARAALGPDTVAGHTVDEKDVILIAPWLLHRHEKLWHDPNAFLPQRFMPGATPPDRFHYMPFGAGPRICIGAHFAVVESVLALAKIIQSYRIELLSSRPAIPIGVVTTQPDHSPVFRITRR